MSDNEANGRPIPLLAILEGGLLRVLDRVKQKNKDLELTDEEVGKYFQEMLTGVKEAVSVVGFGLHTLSPQEDQLLRSFRMLAQKYPQGFDMQVTPRNKSDVVLGPDGKPADLGEKKLVLAKG